MGRCVTSELRATQCCRNFFFLNYNEKKWLKKRPKQTDRQTNKKEKNVWTTFTVEF